MENFVVSARKYRPASFDTVIGQGHVVQTLKNAIKNAVTAIQHQYEPAVPYFSLKYALIK